MSLASSQPQGSLEAAFRRGHPGYPETAVLDELRRSDFARLDRGCHVYLDYTGGGLYAESQLREHMRLLERGVFGNPHSVNPTSKASTELVERARSSVLEFFDASSEEYVAIFTANATGALRLVGEAYPFHPGDRFLLTFDNHNSVNGIREFARARGAETTYMPSVPPDLRVDEGLLPRYLTATAGDHHHLFAYPAQSNYSGVQHPLEWIEPAQSRGWDVLLDGAAYVPTNRLDLSRWHPTSSHLVLQDVRLAHRSGLPARTPRRPRQARAALVLRRHDLASHSCSASTTSRPPAQRTSRTAPSTTSTSRRSRSGCDLPRQVGSETIHARVSALGLPGCSTRSPRAARRRRTRREPSTVRDAWQRRGATGIALQLPASRRCVVDERYVDRVAGRHNISLRTGCFCNPGAGEVAFTISRETLVGGEFGEGMSLDDYVRAIGLPSGGAIRASLGLVSNFADLRRFQQFAAEFIDLRIVPDDLPPRKTC